MILKKKYGYHFMDDIFEVASVTANLNSSSNESI